MDGRIMVDQTEKSSGRPGIRERRKALNLKQVELARIAAVRDDSLGRVERDVRVGQVIRDRVLAALACLEAGGSHKQAHEAAIAANPSTTIPGRNPFVSLDERGEALRARRKWIGLTIVQVAAEAGVQQASISYAERGVEGRVGAETLARIEAALSRLEAQRAETQLGDGFARHNIDAPDGGRLRVQRPATWVASANALGGN